jgi:hypothetical protein
MAGTEPCDIALTPYDSIAARTGAETGCSCAAELEEDASSGEEGEEDCAKVAD